ncbi:PIN domain-containing protein [Bengtsoniella intestinalis]|uniref:PIN domain-containing protein n=1 Tax=Bengtsoniella intestinalis TaxID=3073143 RepID=UPI00391F11EE
MIFLIDFENISTGGLTGIDQLTANDQILLFYSEMANKISIDLHLQLERSPAKREYFCVKTGRKNALDFQLATHLGYLIASNPKEDYAIVSKDEGFNALVDFWSVRNCHVHRCVNLIPAPVVNGEAPSPLKEALPNDLEKIPAIEEIMEEYRTRQNINNALVKVFGADKAYLLYRDIKHLIKK